VRNVENTAQITGIAIWRYGKNFPNSYCRKAIIKRAGTYRQEISYFQNPVKPAKWQEGFVAFEEKFPRPDQFMMA